MTSPIVVAHRGLHDEHPENSLRAFLAAWEAGVEWCECDVRGSREHEPFVFHDETLERTTDGGNGRVDQTPSAALHRANLRRGDGSMTTACVPRLATVIEAMPESARLLIEIKPGVDAETAERTLVMCNPETCVIHSFDTTILRMASALLPQVRRMLLVEDAAGPEALVEGPWEAVNARHDTLTAEAVELIRRRGCEVGVWTPNDDRDIRRAIGLGVEMIISDRPLRVRELIGG
jgi:glycerophosphoryl diester phosphodiesterase